MAELHGVFNRTGDQGPVVFEQTVQAVRSALDVGLHVIFWVGAGAMSISFLLILAIPETPLDRNIQE